jgi:hypothetical protein
MDPEHHDKVLAIVSHLPHLIAYNIVGTADDLGTVTQSEVIKYSASGFRDFTRLAASDPTMWRDVCLHNKDAILEMLARFSEDLAYLQRAIRWGEGDKIFDLFTRTRAIRRSIIEAGQDVDAPDFGRPTRSTRRPDPSGCRLMNGAGGRALLSCRAPRTAHSPSSSRAPANPSPWGGRPSCVADATQLDPGSSPG